MQLITNIFTEVPIPLTLIGLGIAFVLIYTLLGVFIHATQKWWCYATITKVEIPWVWLILTKISLHKLKVERVFLGDNYKGISPFGKKKDMDELVFETATVISLIPTIVYLVTTFWEITLILGVLALLTKLSRVVITVKRKLESHMVDPEAHQDK